MASEENESLITKQLRQLSLRKDFHYSQLPRWQKSVIEKYPALYRARSSPSLTPEQYDEASADDFCNLRSGFECGPGWQGLIGRLSSVADELVTKLKSSGIQRDVSITPMIIKQKIGELRWQGRHNLCPPFDTLWLAYLNQIRLESIQTCEISGEPGLIRNLDGFVICLSDEENLKWKKEPQKQRIRYWQLGDGR